VYEFEASRMAVPEIFLEGRASIIIRAQAPSNMKKYDDEHSSTRPPAPDMECLSLCVQFVLFRRIRVVGSVPLWLP